MATPHALIAGAGIGGLSAALSLARAGWRVSLFEKAPVLEEAGAGLQLSPNASIILRHLGVLERLEPKALVPSAIRVRRGADGAALAVVPLADAERRWGAPYLLAHRADLQRALLDRVAEESRIELQTGVEVRSFVSTADSVTASLASASESFEVTGECLIGADGVRSAVRKRLAEDNTWFARGTAWRALVDADCIVPEMRAEESTLWLGPKAHLVHYPLRGGAVINVVAVVDENCSASETEDFWSSPGDPGAISERFAGWAKPARDLIAAAREWRKWPLIDRDHLRRWTRRRAALLGDAAHPMLPFLAQGAAQAIEDAWALSAALPSEADVETGLKAYAAARQARAARVQRESRRQGAIYHLSGVAAQVRDLAMGALGGRTLMARYDWLYSARAVDLPA